MNPFKSIGGTATWIWGLLGSVVTAATWASLIKNGFDIDLYGLPAAIYGSYASIRDLIYDRLFSWLPFVLPSPVKDLLTMYLVLGIISQRVWILGEPGGNRMHFWPKLLYRARLIITWPQSFKLFYMVIRMHGLWKKVPPQHYAHLVRAIFWLYLVTLIVSLVIAINFFTWNYIQGQALAVSPRSSILPNKSHSPVPFVATVPHGRVM